MIESVLAYTIIGHFDFASIRPSVKFKKELFLNTISNEYQYVFAFFYYLDCEIVPTVWYRAHISYIYVCAGLNRIYLILSNVFPFINKI